MARVVALIPDLLFGSRVQAMLVQAGDEVRLLSGAEGLQEALADADVLVVDLTQDATREIATVQRLSVGSVRTLAFYSHVEADVRARALQAGFDLVVPRSRMAREGAALVAGLLDGS